MSDEIRSTRADRDHWFKMWENARAELAAEREWVVEECAEIVEDLTMQSGMCDGVTAVKRIRAVLKETKGDGDE